MASSSPNLECRMYEARFPDIDTPVMIQVQSIDESIGAYVLLLEYNNIEGMIPIAELSKLRIRSVNKLAKVGHIEPVMVLQVDEDKGYVNLSKRRVSEQDIKVCQDRYSKSKLVHSIMRHVAETINLDLEDLYIHVGWPLYRKYGHAFEAFKLIVNDPDAILNSLTREVKEIGPDGKEVTKVIPALSKEVKNLLVKNIRRRINPQPLKIRADVKMMCHEYDGVLHIKDAMRKAQAAGNEACPVKMMLIAAPYYVLVTHTLDKEQGISVLTKAIVACTEEIERHKGKLTVENAPRSVSERESILLDKGVTEQSKSSEEVEGDSDIEEEEDEG